MPSSTSTTRLGRQVWTSILDSVEILSWRTPLQQWPLQRRRALSGAPPRPLLRPPPPPNRPFPTSRWFSLPSRSRTPPKNVRRSYTSGGLLLLGLTSNPSSAPSVVATCTAATDSTLAVNGVQKANISSLARQAWRRAGQPVARPVGSARGRRCKSSKPESDVEKSAAAKGKPAPREPATKPSNEPQPPAEPESLANSVSKYLHIPKIPHRPTREELLAAASGFWERLKVRFKWFSIRSMRPWNADEWGAFVSWFLFGHLVWILVGTTTFFSLIILFINTVFAQG